MLHAAQTVGRREGHVLKPASAAEETKSCLAEKDGSYESKCKSRKTCSLKEPEVENRASLPAAVFSDFKVC